MIAFLPWLDSSLPRASLAPSQVDLWTVRLAVTSDVEARLATALDEGERDQARRYVFARERRHFRVAHGVLRHLLSAYRNVPPDEHRFVYGPRGKPALAPSTGPVVQFSLAYSGEQAVYAITAVLDVGVAIEELRPIPDALALARRYFSPIDCTTLAALPRQEHLLAFFRCWTRKEAYLRASGEGAGRSPERVAVHFGMGSTPAVRVPQGDRQWSLYQLEPAAGYVGAIAVSGVTTSAAGGSWTAHNAWKRHHAYTRECATSTGQGALAGIDTLSHVEGRSERRQAGGFQISWLQLTLPDRN